MTTTTQPARPRMWPWVLAFLAVFIVAFEAYEPALHGPFLFDDLYLPFATANFPVESLKAWLAGVRPLLMLTYWMNFQLSGTNPFSYHVFNVLLHASNSILVFYIVRKILVLAAVENRKLLVLAAFSGALFLFHPLQTESVAYIASRSEDLSVFFFFAAFALFLYRRTQAITWRAAAGVILLFGAAVVVKEHTVVLPALLLLTDYFWNPGFSFAGIRRNWRVYALMAAGAAAGTAWILHLLTGAQSAGFGVKEFTWLEYFFTQCRAIWVYLRMFVLPYGQNIDPDFPVSHTLLDHGALFGLAALLAATALAVYYRRRFPLASYGWFAFLILMAPTSSFVPLKDPFAEHRLYLSMIALLLVAAEFLRRIKTDFRTLAWALAAVALIAAALTYRRNQVYSDPVALWANAAENSPRKMRPEFQLAHAYYSRGQCQDAVTRYAAAAKLAPDDVGLMVDWGLAYDCANDPGAALAKLREAAARQPSAHIYSQIGMIHGKRGQAAEALQALDTAQKLDPNFELTYVYRGNVLLMRGDTAGAVREFVQALRINPASQQAQDGLAMARSRTGR